MSGAALTLMVRFVFVRRFVEELKDEAIISPPGSFRADRVTIYIVR